MESNQESGDRRVCVIGAGISGICGAIKLRKKFPKWEIIIFERNSEAGGVWCVNSYPGCGVDIPGHLYSFSFAPKSDWERVYPKRIEILQYYKTVLCKFGIRNLILFETSVESVSWNEWKHKWLVKTINVNSRLKEDAEFDLIVNATGFFSSPNTPKIFDDFDGPIFHTSQWDSSICVEDKVVAMIGSGSSAIQLVPEISQKAKELILYQRNPPWVIPRVNYCYSNLTKWTFKYIPFVRVLYRTFFFLLNELNFLAFKSKLFVFGYFGHLIGSLLAKLHLRLQMGSNNSLKSLVTPSYLFGCKRVCISNKYYPCLLKPNVKVVISEVNGIVGGTQITTQDGDLRSVDVIILATGFEVMKYLTYEINLEEGQKSVGKNVFGTGFMGTVYADLPNMFFIQGPGSDTLHNTAVFAIECQCDFIVKVMKQMEEEGKGCVRLKVPEGKLHKKWSDEAFGKTVWKNSCESVNTYFMTSDGNTSSLYPESLISFWWRLLTANVNGILDFE